MIESSFRFRRPYKMKSSEKPSNNQPQGVYAWTQGQGTATDLSYDSCPRISELAEKHLHCIGYVFQHL
ncbi:hypothetical protein FOVSG1_009996 [Fusarium oxysporum f. sp. vasinfectum]